MLNHTKVNTSRVRIGHRYLVPADSCPNGCDTVGRVFARDTACNAHPREKHSRAHGAGFARVRLVTGHTLWVAENGLANL